MTPSEAVEEIKRKKERIINEAVRDIFSELVKVSPVDTGTFRSTWDLQKTSNGWRISNNMEYASILWDGRRFAAGKTLGSIQWPDGGAPILAKYNERIENEFKRIKV